MKQMQRAKFLICFGKWLAVDVITTKQSILVKICCVSIILKNKSDSFDRK